MGSHLYAALGTSDLRFDAALSVGDEAVLTERYQKCLCHALTLRSSRVSIWLPASSPWHADGAALTMSNQPLSGTTSGPSMS